ncbi:hypothetical protein DFH06DRAFT_1434510 [Mycena polygramma]|nr:hypothetical protein DFH06DRAFT_1434510 [Mycena polygramma]
MELRRHRSEEFCCGMIFFRVSLRRVKTSSSSFANECHTMSHIDTQPRNGNRISVSLRLSAWTRNWFSTSPPPQISAIQRREVDFKPKPNDSADSDMYSVAGVRFRTDPEPEPNPNRTQIQVRFRVRQYWVFANPVRTGANLFNPSWYALRKAFQRNL